MVESGTLKAVSKGFLCAIQDQVAATRSYQLIYAPTLMTCRKCHSYAEPVPHMVSGCPTLATNQYL